jgi:hypothetical protein
VPQAETSLVVTTSFSVIATNLAPISIIRKLLAKLFLRSILWVFFVFLDVRNQIVGRSGLRGLNAFKEMIIFKKKIVPEVRISFMIPTIDSLSSYQTFESSKMAMTINPRKYRLHFLVNV